MPPALVWLALLASMAQDVPDPGGARVEPDFAIAGRYGTWTFVHRVGRDGIRTGGSLWVELPDSWHASVRNSAIPLQATDPRAPHYVSADTSRDGVELATEVEGEERRWLVKRARPSLDGRMHRYAFVVRVRVAKGLLEAGDTVRVGFGDTSGGSFGMRASTVAVGPEPVRFAVDPIGDGRRRLQPGGPLVTTRPGPIARAIVTAPSVVGAGEQLDLRVAFVDRFANPVADAAGELALRLLSGTCELPARHRFERGPATVVNVFGLVPGTLRVEVLHRDSGVVARSNPIVVTAASPAERLLWGDLHSHSHHSWDAVGDAPHGYARDVAGLDFYARTDHAMAPRGGGRGLRRELWEEYCAINDRYDEPGRFAVLHAYELSLGSPWGHHNVYFRGAPGPLLYPGQVTLPQLWERLTAGEALTIPHHTGAFPAPVRFDVHDPRFRRVFEIYSGHGLSEARDPHHPLAFEASDFSNPRRSVDGPQFAHDAWLEGLRLGVVAASDDHRARPGQPHFGVAAVWAERLDRASVFDALAARRCYGTTGARIVLRFWVAGAPMGGRVQSGPDRTVRVRAVAPSRVRQLEVLRALAGDDAFEVVHRIDPATPEAAVEFVDRGVDKDAVYYCRVRDDEEVWGRIAMAWSSPVWVEAAR